MKYKVGDKVRIKSLKWWNSLPKTAGGGFNGPGGLYFNPSMCVYLGKEYTISALFGPHYQLNIPESWSWADWMFEDSPDKKYKVGDVLRIAIPEGHTRWGCGFYHNLIGSQCIVCEVSDKYTVMVKGDKLHISEEYLIPYKEYKIGDKVRIHSTQWFIANKNEEEKVDIGSQFLSDMAACCGHVVTITGYEDEGYRIENSFYTWDAYMFDETYEDVPLEEIQEEKEEVVQESVDPLYDWLFLMLYLLILK